MIRTELIRPVHELVLANAGSQGSRTAFDDSSRATTWAELADRTARLASGLRELGVGAGDRVGMYMSNGVAAVESYLAISRAGAIGVCLNPQLTAREAQYMLADSGSVVLIADAERARTIEPVRSELPDLRHVAVVDGEWYTGVGRESDAAPDSLKLDDTAWILYTSGTTGRPKGVQLTQRGMLWVVAGWVPILGLSAQDRFLSPLPLFHSYALNVSVLAVAALGASERVMERFTTEETFRLLREDSITFLPGVPTMFNYLVRSGGDLTGSRLRVCISAGAILPSEVNRQFEERYGIPLLDCYGITETSTFVTFNWLTGHRTHGSCGLPLLGLCARVVDPATGVDRPAGVSGELIVRGPLVTPGYWNRPESTAEAIRDGWYHTGDLAMCDENGYLTIVGRVKELIISGGYNIAPAELEDVALTHPSVVDCAAVGVPDEMKGEVPVLFVCWRDGRDQSDQLMAHLRGGLARYKLPARLATIDQVPRTGSGKILRYQLKALEATPGS